MLPRHALSALGNAFRSPGSRIFGIRFALDYLRFAVHCARSWGSTGRGRVRIMGLDIAYPNQSHALFLVHEVFVQAVYAFRSASPAPFIIDCGANIGFTTLFFTRLFPGARIIAVEPEPGTAAWLRTNVERNAPEGVRIVEAAVAGQEGTVTLFAPETDPGSMTSSTREEWTAGAGTQVRAIRLSTLIDGPVDFLKLDVEGAEYEVVRELVATGAIARVRQTTIEYHPLASEPDGAETLAKLLAGAGMEVSVAPGEPGQPGIIHGRRPAPGG
jgi:FkbM family methyltransferase